ncbi:MAG: MBL fold metallo-hydrolase, partial [Oceanospirillaceae bacterium]|nr:MBL fold metallo-hydrolase [Oceanospirillaceae bacterium]
MVGLIRTIVLLSVCVATSVYANTLQRIEVTEDIFALIGPMEQRSETNLANNANFGFIVGERGVVLIDSGGTLKGAKAIEAQIRAVTDKPIVLVINTGGQDHRWFGNRYFAEQGIRTLTSEQTLADQHARGEAQMASTSRYTGDSWQGTEVMPAKEAVSTVTDMSVEGIELQLIPVGPAHTGGETLVWLPESGVLFSGDIVYMDRMLGIGPQSQHLAWLDAFKV